MIMVILIVLLRVNISIMIIITIIIMILLLLLLMMMMMMMMMIIIEVIKIVIRQSKQHPKRQWHRGKGVLERNRFLEPCRAEKHEGSNMQGVLWNHCLSFVALRGFADRDSLAT